MICSRERSWLAPRVERYLAAQLREAHLWMLAASLAVASSGGCAMLVPRSMLMPTPQVEGRWTGTLTSVTVTDSDGQRHEAAGVRIEKGPRLPYEVSDHHVRRLALLVDGERRWIIDPEETRLPPGSRVRVQGIMRADSITARPSAQHPGEKFISLGTSYEIDHELVISQPKLQLLQE